MAYKLTNVCKKKLGIKEPYIFAATVEFFPEEEEKKNSLQCFSENSLVDLAKKVRQAAFENALPQREFLAEFFTQTKASSRGAFSFVTSFLEEEQLEFLHYMTE